MRVCGILYLLIAFSFSELIFTQDSNNQVFLNSLHPSWSFNSDYNPEPYVLPFFSNTSTGISGYHNIRGRSRLFTRKTNNIVTETFSIDSPKDNGKHTQFVKLNTDGRPISITHCKIPGKRNIHCITLNQSICNLLIQPRDHLRDCQNAQRTSELGRKCLNIFNEYMQDQARRGEHSSNLQKMIALSGVHGQFIRNNLARFNPTPSDGYPGNPQNFFRLFATQLSLCSENAFESIPAAPPSPAQRLHFIPPQQQAIPR